MSQSRLDAIADAETLRLYYACAGFPGASSWDASLAPAWPEDPGVIRITATAARAAFRAVPDLKGPDYSRSRPHRNAGDFYDDPTIIEKGD